MDISKREPKVDIEVPNCIAYQLHTEVAASEVGKAGTVQKLFPDALQALMDKADTKDYQERRIREGMVELL